MEQNIHYDILTFIAEEIVAELYATAQQDARIMVCDWRAYAIREAYKLYDYLMGTNRVPDIELCFRGDVTPRAIIDSYAWKALSELHRSHWERYQAEGEEMYAEYLDLPLLKLKHFTLSI